MNKDQFLDLCSYCKHHIRLTDEMGNLIDYDCDKRHTPVDVSYCNDYKNNTNITSHYLIDDFLAWIEKYHPIKQAWELWNNREGEHEDYPYDYFREYIFKPKLVELIQKIVTGSKKEKG